MNDIVLLRVNTKDQARIVFALELLSDEYKSISCACSSNYLRNGFEQDANLARALARDIKLVEPMMTKAELEATVQAAGHEAQADPTGHPHDWDRYEDRNQ